ncbi:hypothetical protein HDU99_001593 [Rhizoclosmatium hyalinum]|nr:hypothetical protein HDU99_001593 [Rhizoclosmatium hyalinum]
MVLATPIWIVSPRLFRFLGRQAKVAFTSTAAILHWLFMGNIEFVITGEPSFERQQIVFANHQTLTDWWWLGLCAWHQGTPLISGIKIILMDYLKYVPFFGWLAYLIDFIFLKQKWALDEATFARSLTPLPNRPSEPLWLLIFPEGLLLHQKNLNSAAAFIEKQKASLPPGSYTPRLPTNVILPRSKGLYTCIKKLNNPEAIAPVTTLMDVTFAFSPSAQEQGLFPNQVLTPLAFFGKGTPDIVSRVHIDFRRMEGPVNGVDRLSQLSETEFTEWLNKRWEVKDDLLGYFRKNGQFEGFVGARHDQSIQVGARETSFKIVPKAMDFLRVFGAFFALWSIIAVFTLIGVFVRA